MDLFLNKNTMMKVDNRIELVKGDITKLEVDAVVNAANKSLKGGGGVDGAIHRAAGPILHEQCMMIINKMGGELPVGEAAITQAGNMPCKYVIHTVGPIWRGGNKWEDRFLIKAYRSSLQLAVDFGLKTVAFPNISTGIYGFPKDKAAEIAVNEVNRFLSENNFIEKVIFCCFEDDNYELYRNLIESK
jgi:O-acetyl-ADP-ribose deacetylase (regulator of RNase III)